MRDKRPEEGIKEYIKDVWNLVESNTENEDAQRLWLTHITSHPVVRKEPPQSHYEWSVLKDINDEDAYLAKAQAGIDQSKTLSQIWHKMKQVVVLPRLWGSKGCDGREEGVNFITMPAETTVPQIDHAVKSGDLEHQHGAGHP